MPLIDLTYPEGALTPEARDTLADELTTAILRAERAPAESGFFRDVTWVNVHETTRTYTSGRPVEAPVFRVDATTPEGALSDRRREEFVVAATDAVKRAAGIPDDQLLRVFILHHEIPEGSWGAGGQTVRFAALREAAAAEREKAQAAPA